MKGYRVAYEEACRKFKEIDPEKASLRCGCRYNKKEQKIYVECLGNEYAISYPEAEVKFKNLIDGPSEGIEIVILHYLLSEERFTFSGDRLISFRELPGGNVYYDAFQRWAIEPIANHFNKKPNLFEEASLMLKGTKVKYGDLAFCIPCLPKVPLTYILWRGNEELPDGAGILFNYSASSWLHTEDLAFLGEFTTECLING